MAKKAVVPTFETHFTCNMCGQVKSDKDFYNSNSYMNKATSKMPICKSCVIELFEYFSKQFDNDLLGAYYTCKRLDIYFVSTLFESAMEEVMRRDIGSSAFQIYMKNINSLPQYRNFGFEDSDPFKQEEQRRHEQQQIAEELKEKWGTGEYTAEDYHTLENFYQDMSRSYEIETASHKDYLKKICKTSLKMEKALDNGSIDEFKKLSDIYDKLMHSAKFAAVQRSASDKTGNLNTFSEFFDLVEKEGFIPNWILNEPRDIVDETIDNINNFTRTLVLGDSNLMQIVEETINKMNSKEDVEKEEIDVRNNDEDIIYDDEIELDLVEDEGDN